MMKAVLFVVVVAALLFIESKAQCTGSCCRPDINFHCVGVNSKCENTARDLYACKDSYRSSDNADCVCTAYKTLNQACQGDGANNDCRDFTTEYDIFCSSGNCRYPAAVSPGETCPTDASVYAGNSPCIVTGRNCSGNCGNVASATGSCDNLENFCPHGAYCSGNVTAVNKTCAARAASGATCGGNAALVSLECDWDLVCSGGRCIAPFSVGVEGACTYPTDCQTNLLCANGRCTNPTNGQACVVTNSGSDCPASHSCACDGSSGDNGKCVASTFDNELANRIKALMTCMKGSTCVFDAPWSQALFPNLQHTLYVGAFTPDSCFHKQCQSQTKAVVEYFGGGDGCGAGAAGTLTVAAALVFVLALLAMMF